VAWVYLSFYFRERQNINVNSVEKEEDIVEQVAGDSTGKRWRVSRVSAQSL